MRQKSKELALIHAGGVHRLFLSLRQPPRTEVSMIRSALMNVMTAAAMKAGAG